MFADLTWGKVIYDVLMALLTGVFAGFLVELILRRRERVRKAQVMQLLSSELLKLTDEFLILTLPIECLVRSPRWYVFGPNLDTFVALDTADSSLFEDETPAHRKLREAAKSERRQSRVTQVEQLMRSRNDIEGVYQRYGQYLDPEGSALLARLHKSIRNAIFYDLLSEKRANREEFQDAYVSELMEAWRSAYRIHSAKIRQGRILTEDEFLSRLSPVGRSAVTSRTADRHRAR